MLTQPLSLPKAQGQSGTSRGDVQADKWHSPGSLAKVPTACLRPSGLYYKAASPVHDVHPLVVLSEQELFPSDHNYFGI